MKIVSIVGARPQFVKESIFQKELRKHSDIEEILVHTGQHYDFNMSESFFKDLNIDMPKYNLNINNKTNTAMTAEMMLEIEKILITEKPDYILVYGDTNSTLAGALVARKMGIKVVHIEAGLRQNPKDMPEEINRVLTDHSSHLLFTPSIHAVENLKFEGIVEGVHNVGDIMYDLFLENKKHFNQQIHEKFNLKINDYIVLTMHRDFNVDDPKILEKILIALKKISMKITIVFPIHPRTRSRIKQFGFEHYLEKIMIINPLSYFDLMGLTMNSKKVITDSGGFQKESYFLNKNACVLMPDTAWIELIKENINTLVNHENLFDVVFNKSNEITNTNIYGNGKAAKKIIEIIIKDYNKYGRV